MKDSQDCWAVKITSYFNHSVTRTKNVLVEQSREFNLQMTGHVPVSRHRLTISHRPRAPEGRILQGHLRGASLSGDEVDFKATRGANRICVLVGKYTRHSLVSFPCFIMNSLCILVSFSVSIKHENYKPGSIQISLQEGWIIILWKQSLLSRPSLAQRLASYHSLLKI